MASLLQRWLGTADERAISTVDEYVDLVNSFYHNGIAYGLGGTSGVQQTLGGPATEAPAANFQGFARSCYAANGPVFSCELVRMSVFSAVDFAWQRLRNGLPSDLWANDPNLRLLQRPWVGGTTQDLLVSMILDADLAGNAYITRHENELVRMRPDWVEIVLEPRMIGGAPLDPNDDVDKALAAGQLGWRKLGYLYTEGGPNSKNDPVFRFADEVAHFAPTPDPLATYRGMSWLTPVIREVTADAAMTKHQRKFFDNGATVNMIVKYAPGTQLESIKAFREIMDERHQGVDNAYKTLHIAPGADPVPVGANMQQVDFKSVRGAGETRIASAAGVPPVIAGFSEGLAAATYSNYSQARRRFADGTMHPLWQNAAGSLENLLPIPTRRDGTTDFGNRLWYNTSNVPFLREDEKDAAEIAKTEAETINNLITAGYEPDSVVAAVKAQDWGLLKHTGMVSVQLMRPGQNPNPQPNTATPSTTGAASAAPRNGNAVPAMNNGGSRGN